MALDVKEISHLIKEQISSFDNKIQEANDIGTVVTVGDSIALIYGLNKGMLGELVIFNDKDYGMIMNLDEDSVYVAILKNTTSIKEGDKVRRTNKVVEVPVGDELLGRVVNALGEAIDGKEEIKCKETSVIEKIAPGIIKRESVNEPLETGILTIDSMIPIGKGQRELIIGDRQTGKTAIALDTIINQKNKNVKCIYVAIGQKNSSVASIYKKLKDTGAMDYTIIVNSSASEIVSLQYLAPYSAITMAEYFAFKGEDVLIVFDDLSKHAVSYRALSLLLKRSPGREAYPGDIFYIHSKLLERCVKLNKEHGGGSITALPIVETQAGDISSYIPTNIISITDGQIFLSTDLFNIGQRPAINIGLSVSRVGSAAQYKFIKKASSSLKMEIASYHELQSFTQFGSDIDISTKKIINHGNTLMEVLKQNQYSPLSSIDEFLILFISKNGYLDDLDKNIVKKFLNELVSFIKKEDKELIKNIENNNDIKESDINKLHELIKKYKEESLINEQ